LVVLGPFLGQASLHVAFGVALELLYPTGERHSLASRLRGTCLYVVFLTSVVLVGLLMRKIVHHLGIMPLFAVDLSSFRGTVIGFLVLPFCGIFVFDFFYYWFHRMQHTVPFLWRLHAVHHAIRELNATNASHHPSEEFLRIPLLLLPMALIVTIEAPHTAALTFFSATFGLAQHSNTRASYGWFRYLFSEPRYHRVHHSLEPQHWERNFAFSFPLWDMIFRTAYWPRRDEWPATGLSDMPEATTWQTYLWPRIGRQQPSTVMQSSDRTG
jgi:sterol desaturase/sphingolipid hydroxylase (fatty acid hydroxylase superfamily)